MWTNLEMRRKNPFRVSFLSVAVICCVALSIVFFYISYVNGRENQERNTVEKMELLMRDFETQLQMMEDVSLRIASNYEFYPYYFKQNVARELSMLETFKQYRYYMALTEEYFLYYGGSRIYRSTGSTLDLGLFLQTKSQKEEEWRRFRRELEMMQTELTEIHGALSVISIFEEVYVLIPLRVSGNGQQSTAVLGFAVEPGALEERFQFVSGGLTGQMTLYGEEGEILFSSQDEPCREGEKDVLTVASGDGRYRFCCRLQREPIMQGSLFLLQIVLVLSDVVLVFVIANVFAAKAYKPLQILTEKYHGKVSDKKAGHENALEELNYMMDSMLQTVEAQAIKIWLRRLKRRR